MRPLPPDLVQALEREGEGLTALVVRLGALGDVLRTLPPVRLVRRALPHARIHWAVEEKWSEVLTGHPDLNQVVALPRGTWQRWLRSPARWPDLLRSVAALRLRLRSLEPDLVLDFQGNLRSGMTGRLAGAPVRLGYDGHQQKEGNRWLSTHRVPSGSRRTPRMERNLDLVRALGIPDRPLPDGGLPPNPAGDEAAQRILGELTGPATSPAVLSPGVSRQQSHKKPPATLLVAASRRLGRRGVPTLVVWGPGEESEARVVTRESEGHALLAPPTDLATLAALLRRARLYVGGDSGPLHLACAVGCPVVGLYGPTDPRVNRPWGVPFRAIHPPDRTYTGVKRLDRARGFEDLTPERVDLAIDSLLEEVASRA